LAGIIVWAIYSFYYTPRSTVDQFKYFDDAVIMFEAFKNNPDYFIQLFFDTGRNKTELVPYYESFMNWDKQYNYAWIIDNRTVIRFNALVCFFSWGNFHVHTVFMNVLSFTGLLLLYKSVYHFFKTKEKLLFVAVFLLPTVLFWGSGVLKEGILILGLGMFVYGFFNAIQAGNKGLYSLALLAGIILLALVKVYVLLCLLPACLTYLLLKQIKFKNVLVAFVLIQIVLLFFIFNLKFFHSELDIVNKLWFKRNDFVNVAHDFDAKSAITPVNFEKSTWSIILHTPEAIYTTLLRPHIFEIKSIMYIMPIAENSLMLLMLLAMLFFFTKPDKETFLFLLFALVFILYLSAMIGLVTPILGAIVRYKLPLMPFLFLIFLSCIDREKLINKVPLLNKFI
jgi:hypothetical protein